MRRQCVLAGRSGCEGDCPEAVVRATLAREDVAAVFVDRHVFFGEGRNAVVKM